MLFSFWLKYILWSLNVQLLNKRYLVFHVLFIYLLLNKKFPNEHLLSGIVSWRFFFLSKLNEKQSRYTGQQKLNFKKINKIFNIFTILIFKFFRKFSATSFTYLLLSSLIIEYQKWNRIDRTLLRRSCLQDIVADMVRILKQNIPSLSECTSWKTEKKKKKIIILNCVCLYTHIFT